MRMTLDDLHRLAAAHILFAPTKLKRAYACEVARELRCQLR
jgi:hypothetical protein